MILGQIIDNDASALSNFLDCLRRRLQRPDPAIVSRVREILDQLRDDPAPLETLKTFGLRFDATAVTDFSPIVEVGDIESARVEPEIAAAIDYSILQVKAFHEAQLATLTGSLRPEARGARWTIPTPGGGFLGQRLLPVACAGIYVPGGKASYPSSLIMNAVPALIAGVNRIVVATPASPDGTLPASVLYTARRLGLSDIVKAGGAYGIGALAFGVNGHTPRCDVIAGPGNRYVNEAKRQLWGYVGLDGYAGPSEVVVVVDDNANSRFAAADLLNQVEHAEDNFGCLITYSRSMLDRIVADLGIQLAGSPREAVMRAALRDHGVGIVVPDPSAAAEIINAIAPEHLSLQVTKPEELTERVRNAGSISEGPFGAQSAGDYVAGPSHTLPTSGGARFGGPTNVLTFTKLTSLSRLTESDLAEMLPAIEAFGRLEGFPAHAKAASIRFDRI